MKSILLVEDEENFGALLKDYLELSNYRVTWSKTGTEAYSTFMKNTFDLCILDVMLPYMDGFTLARKIRKENDSVPLFFLTAKNAKPDILEGYSVGADDYLNKPFDTEILLMKIAAIFNRTKEAILPEAERYAFGQYTFIPKDRILKGTDSDVKLSPKEAGLLALLCAHLNEVLPSGVALKKVWEEENYFTKRSMDVYITKLRKRLKADSRVSIETFHQVGYQLRVKE